MGILLTLGGAEAACGTPRWAGRTCLQLQAQLAERTALAEREANQSRRLQEEAQGLRKRVEKLEKVTVVTDESLRVVNEALLVRGR